MVNESELLTQIQAALVTAKYFLPFKKDVVTAIFLGRPFSLLDISLREVSTGYLNMPVYQEICVDTLVDVPAKIGEFITNYSNGHLVVTKHNTIEEKVLNFSHVYFVVDVALFKLLMASPKWQQIVEFARDQRNHFLVFGTIVNDRYVHHKDIPPMDIITLVPQYIDDINASQELDVGVQLLGAKKTREFKKRSVD